LSHTAVELWLLRGTPVRVLFANILQLALKQHVSGILVPPVAGS